MPRRIPDYPDAYIGWNIISSYGSIVSIVATCIFFFMIFYTLGISRTKWVDEPDYQNSLFSNRLVDNKDHTLNQIGVFTLEWTLDSPPVPHTFEEVPYLATSESFHLALLATNNSSLGLATIKGNNLGHRVTTGKLSRRNYATSSHLNSSLPSAYAHNQSTQYHPYHIVTPSPWPIYCSFSALIAALSFIVYLDGYIFGAHVMSIGITMITIGALVWFRDIVREATFQGHHTLEVQQGLKEGILLFILSEVLLFFSFFWAFFHNSLSPSIEIGGIWPPTGIELLDPFKLPLLGTIILLTSGATVTWAHHGLIAGNRHIAIWGLFFTLLLGAFFTFLQGTEYFEAPYTIADSVFGATFFSITGLHGFHVIVGSLALFVCFLRVLFYHFSRSHHIGLEASIIYW
jgi:cytochrome c oxidase subunit 3